MKSFFTLFASGAKAQQAKVADAARFVREGIGAEDRGDIAGARKSYESALALIPDHVEALFNLGNACTALDRMADALRCYRRVIELDADHFLTHLNLGATFLRTNTPGAAANSYREALRLQPVSAAAWTGLGCALDMLSDVAGAESAFERALECDPSHEGAASRLAQSLRARGAARKAVELLDAALRQSPDSILLLRTRADICGGVGEYEEAVEDYRRILDVADDDTNASSNLLWTLNFWPELGAERILAEHRVVGERLLKFVSRMPIRRIESHKRRLRIGYVSPDFCRHSVSCFIEPLLRAHDRTRFEIHCFHDYPSWDDVTERINKSSERWHEIAGVPDQLVAQRIADSEIDILVDLAGHSAHNRLRVFAAKPAPLQFTWLGYLCTTGLSTIDYRVCDRFTDPPGIAEAWQVEQPARLRDSQWCYQPQIELPEPAPLPMLRNGYLTFGSFNQESKLNSSMLSVWARVLAAIPASRLRVIGVTADVVENRIRNCMADHGIAAERLELVGRLPLEGYFAAFNDVDIALDSFPYNGATTTCDALIMGVPVATVAGDRSISRGGVSLLTTLGLTEWISSSDDGLVALIWAKLSDPKHLVDLRTQLRERMRHSPLMDGARFARNMEALFELSWRREPVGQTVER